ncbi:MAG TPA: RNA polymerase sigma factor [Acidobacteriota bacterium]|nr:RNA polymerase sigma factor [Acidobacteriota bacterium]
MPLEQLWQEHEAVFRKVVRTMVADSSSSDDVMQESYLRLLSRSSPVEPTFPYLRRVLVNVSLDHYRRRGRRCRHLLHIRAAQVPDPVPTPLTLLLEREEEDLRLRVIEEIRRVSSALPPDLSFALGVYFGPRRRSIREICRRCGLPYSTLRSRLLAALRHLRMHLRRKGLYQDYRYLKGGPPPS